VSSASENMWQCIRDVIIFVCYADHYKMINVMAQKVGILGPRIPVITLQEVEVNAKYYR